MKVVTAEKKGIELAVKYLRAGKSVVYPTDTAYGLGVDATNLAAIKKLIKIKNRPGRPIHIIDQKLTIVKNWSIMDETTRSLMKKFFPGPLTLVLHITPPAGEAGNHVSRALKLLSAGTGTIGIRMPDSRIALELVKRLGRPITTPSANPHGRLTPYSVAESLNQFKGKKYQPDLYLDAGKLPKTKPSTIVSVRNGKIKILRKGPITKTQIQRCLI